MGEIVVIGCGDSSGNGEPISGPVAQQIPEDYSGGVGHGITYIDGKGLFEVVAPRIRRMDLVKEAIADLVTR